MRTIFSVSLSVFLYSILAQAQFQFFEQMFQGGGQQQQAPQNAASDASWYQQNYENSNA
jgi:hypothetical protein